MVSNQNSKIILWLCPFFKLINVRTKCMNADLSKVSIHTIYFQVRQFFNDLFDNERFCFWIWFFRRNPSKVLIPNKCENNIHLFALTPKKWEQSEIIRLCFIKTVETTPFRTQVELCLPLFLPIKLIIYQWLQKTAKCVPVCRAGPGHRGMGKVMPLFRDNVFNFPSK